MTHSHPLGAYTLVYPTNIYAKYAGDKEPSRKGPSLQGLYTLKRRDRDINNYNMIQ